ncbi:ArgE/DapE family deacylase [Oscillochloris sp. ZM17-4]|uniref:ArgE/DapE family deacylase n=1 Tax=Oscillochloris sp. ZM17-4 TaxID=2866714 RepID=UPI001C73CE6E|nr:ArgE/DapE family deacylase [Oscillochloris sp. ZM17-4]MBX0326390.1 ArgE/DapE family deacylase [Oscillochloris sp. ZM17-4]
MDTLTRLLSDLVAIDSVNPDLVPGGAGEGQIARFIASWLADAGLDVHLDEVSPGRPNVIGVARGTGGGKALLLNGHTDTVGVAGMAAPHRPRVEGGRMYGRGAYDMKGGLAACMVAAAEARRRGLRGDLIITAVVDEEYAGMGTLDVAARYRADAAIVAEPTELRLMTAHKGFVWLDVEIAGAAAHGSIPGAVDAIARMGGVLLGIDQLNRQLMARPSHPLLGSGTIHASMISGGQEQSSYAERCALAVERRTVPGETPAQAESELRAILDRLAADTPDLRATLRPGVHRAPMETPADAALPALIRRHAAAVAGRETPIIGGAYWTDAASLAEAGIPAVLFGPGGAGAHAAEEWVDLESVAQCAAIYGRVIDEFCG